MPTQAQEIADLRRDVEYLKAAFEALVKLLPLSANCRPIRTDEADTLINIMNGRV